MTLRGTHTAAGFAEAFLGAVWMSLQLRRVGEAESYQDLRAAIYALRTMTGLTVEQLAARLGMVPYRLSLLEKRGSPIEIADIKRMEFVARDFALYRMQLYFSRQALLYRDKLKLNRRRPQK